MDDIFNDSANSSPAMQSSEVYYIFRDPEIFPKVGVDYQAYVPSLIPGAPHLQLKRRKSYAQITLNKQYAKVHAALDKGKETEDSLNHQPMLTCDNMDIMLFSAQGSKANSESEAWTATECHSFLLGLYFFGKNLMVVRKFVETKDMGDILAYYYGKFYRSSDYQRWSESRKLKNRRYVHGQRILDGWRQQELLSRLFCCVSEECQTQLTEVSTTFAEGKLSLEEYVFTLRAMVGTNILVEAIAIGKGKKDLTRTATDPSKANGSMVLGAGIPSGKGCSSLTSSEIVKFLTGDFRLSKARSSDLFWEAVWPRLLAGGWHSEQPRSLAYADPNYSLVYIIPGVKKFSRKLVRGSQYFDSISDVLKKVASEPHLLEFDNEAAEDSTMIKDDMLALQKEQELEGLSIQKCHTYLQPPISTCSQNLMKFTVVDTSLFRERGRVNLRELRFLPPDPSSKRACSNEENMISDPLEDVSETRPCNDTESLQPLPAAPDHTGTAVENHHDRISTPSASWKSRMTVKFQFSRRLKKNKLNHSASIADEQNFTGGRNQNSTNDAGNISMDANSNVQGSSSLKSSPPFTEPYLNSSSNGTFSGILKESSERNVSKNFPVTEPCNEKSDPEIAIDSSSNGTFSGILKESSERNVSKNFPVTEPCNEKSDPEIAIDLNSPQVPTDSQLVEELSHVMPNPTLAAFLHHSEGTEQSRTLVTDNAGAGVISRRQSTRNKPSTKGLEAIAFGFIGTKQKRKCVEVISGNDCISMPSQCVHGKSHKFEYFE